MNLVEVQWRAASTPGGADGSAALLINGVLEARAPNLMNGQFDVRSIQLGVMRAPDAQTMGSLYFDTFESFRLPAR